jgi:HD superfamily phosphodiesterase
VTTKSGRINRGFAAAVSARYPGLLEDIRMAIEESERSFAGGAPESDGSFLWEHTVHVASLAHALARSEKTDPALAAIVALFHDAGKFAGGRYHEGDEPEESEAARLAGKILRRRRVKAADRAAVEAALRALYNESAPPNAAADIVHDADFLSKFGLVGVAQFFIKSTLRGKTLRTAVANSLSKELTYAACLPLNMRTAAGRTLAERKAADALAFYGAFIRELAEVHGLSFKIETQRIPHPRRPGGEIEVRMVVAEKCDACGGPWKTSLSASTGTKCDRLEARVRCARCGASHEISFCLPELAAVI